MDKEGNKAVNWLKHRLIPIFLTFVIVFYIFYSTIDVSMADPTAYATFSIRIAITLIFGLLITSLMGEGGYTTGKDDPDFKATRDLAVDYSNKILPRIEEATAFVNKQIEDKVRQKRETILQGGKLAYSDVFDENGVFIYTRKNHKRIQTKAAKKARKITKKPFDLLAYSDNDALGLEDAPSEVKRRSKKNIKLFGTRTLLAVVSGSVVFSFSGWSIESFIYTLAQLIIWIGAGLIERFDNYNYIVVKVRNYDKERIKYIKEFLAIGDTKQDTKPEFVFPLIEVNKNEQESINHTNN